MKVVICDGPDGFLDPIVETITEDEELDLIDVVHTGVALKQVLRDGSANLCVMSPEVLDIDRVVGRHLGEVPPPRKVVMATDMPASLIVKAHQLGLDDVIELHLERRTILHRLKEASKGNARISDHPALRGLSLAARSNASNQVRHGDPDDPDIMTMLGLGLSDEEIAAASGLSLQRVRNRIASLILLNEVRTRTQLVVLQATDLHIPDFI